MRRVKAAWRALTSPRVYDIAPVVVLVLIMTLGIVSTIATGLELPPASSLVISLISFGALLARRSHPLLVAAFVTAAEILLKFVSTDNFGGVAVMVAYYSVGRHTSGRRMLAALVLGMVAYGTGSVLADLDRDLAGSSSSSLGILMAVVIGQLFRLRAELRARSRKELADAAVSNERRRIARELHDVVAHHLTVVNALVGGARASLPPGHETTKEALSGAEQTARQALDEMRQLLHVLRADGTDGADASTGVGAARLPSLVAEASGAGLPTSLEVSGDSLPLPANVDHAVYRIVQEALTNTRKHAEGARASVRLAYDEGGVEVEVLDDGVPSVASMPPGFGLRGMAERVALCGGTLATGPRSGGGFRVHARLPL
ncbi:sensor histidine kinase [Nonomuraea longicatena]|uniref:histidine kinase n=1 Tax=Nonomuraea longicatena TaxID=83682 RepID=A0ABN1R595_9ACTN